jgi:mRNA interferase HigB
MHVISKKPLEVFWKKHPAARVPLEAWYKLLGLSTFANYLEVKQTFNTADYVPPFIVFDIAGNNFRIISAVHFNQQKLYIRGVFTHAEYDRWSRAYRSKKPWPL